MVQSCSEYSTLAERLTDGARTARMTPLVGRAAGRSTTCLGAAVEQ